VSADLVVAHLYPDLLRTYGDRGNVLALRRRAEWRGFRVQVVPVRRGERLPRRVGIVVLGGGTDRIQELVAEDLRRRLQEMRDTVASGALVLGVCGGYQLLGRSYAAADGTELEGLGLLDATTEAGPTRLIGRVQCSASLWGRRFPLVGFENHAGRTRLGEGARPLALVSLGEGNDGTGTEGAVQGSVVGTYLHGPVLPGNPDLADTLLEEALRPVTGGGPLPPLDDRLERTAQSAASRLAR
jgi:lipid II isoglutaminyl synthase (glutamine-hydrolysing)